MTTSRICYPRPCELPPITAKHRACVIACPWCEALYRQRAYESEWKWSLVNYDDARMYLKVNSG